MNDVFCSGRLALGVNYWGSKAGVRMWTPEGWDAASVEKDIAALAAHGIELLRVFPTWDAFQPLVRERKFGGMPGMVLETTRPTSVDAEEGALLDLRPRNTTTQHHENDFP